MTASTRRSTRIRERDRSTVRTITRPGAEHGFLTLSDELLLMIMENLSSLEDVKTMAHICKRFNPIASQVLYRSVEIFTAGQLQKLVIGHNLRATTKKAVKRHLACHTRSLTMHMHGRQIWFAGDRDPSSPVAKRNVHRNMLVVINACSRELLSHFDIAFRETSTLKQQLEFAEAVSNAGICCGDLGLQVCHVDAIPALVMPHQANLEVLKTATLRQNSHTISSSQSHDIVERMLLPKLHTIGIGEYAPFRGECASEILLRFATQIKQLLYFPDPSPGNDERSSHLFRECTFSRLESLDCFGIDRRDACDILASATRLKNIRIEDMHNSPRSVLSCLPTTLESLTLGFLSPLHDPPEAVDSFIRTLPNLAACPRISYDEEDLDFEDFEEGDEALFRRVDAARDQISAYLKTRNIQYSEEEAKELLYVDLYDRYSSDSDTDSETSDESSGDEIGI